MDRYIYLLKRGAPLHGSTLPQDWTDHVIKKFLGNEGIESHNELSIRDRTEILTSRYESVRLGLEVFFGSTLEPVNNSDWMLSKTEGFDVFNVVPGSKYWRHQKDSIFYINGSGNDMIEHMRENRNRDELLIGCEAQDREKRRTPTGMQNVTNGGKSTDNSGLKRPSASEIDTERSIDDDHEDDVQKCLITETEEILVESMREGYIAASVMSEAALEELWLPAEQYLRDEPDPKAAPDLHSSDSTGCESAEPASAHSVKTLDEISFVAPEVGSVDNGTPSNRGPEGHVQIHKERMTPGPPEGPRGRYEGRQIRKAEIKARKRRSRADYSVTVHEDHPPQIERPVHMNLHSPGTDIPKENLENNGLVEHSDQVEIRMPQMRGRHGVVGPRSDRQRGSASVFGVSFGSSASGSSRTIT